MNRFLLTVLLLAFIPLSVAKADDDLNRLLNLKFTAVDGKKVDLAQMRGKVVLVDFWATWCPGCVEAVPDVVAAYNKFHDKGFEVVGISLDQDKHAMLNFTQKNGMAWPQYFDGQGWDNAISSSFGIQQIPIMVLIGKDGKPIQGDGADLSSAVEKAIKGPTN